MVITDIANRETTGKEIPVDVREYTVETDGELLNNAFSDIKANSNNKFTKK